MEPNKKEPYLKNVGEVQSEPCQSEPYYNTATRENAKDCLVRHIKGLRSESSSRLTAANELQILFELLPTKLTEEQESVLYKLINRLI